MKSICAMGIDFCNKLISPLTLTYLVYFERTKYNKDYMTLKQTSEKSQSKGVVI